MRSLLFRWLLVYLTLPASFSSAQNTATSASLSWIDTRLLHAEQRGHTSSNELRCLPSWTKGTDPKGWQARVKISPATSASKLALQPRRAKKGTFRWLVSPRAPGTWELLCCVFRKGSGEICGAMPASLRVSEGAPTRMTLSLPGALVRRAWLRPHRMVRLGWSLFDANGVLVPGTPPLVVELVTPSLLWPAVGSLSSAKVFWHKGRFLRFLRDGRYRLRVFPRGMPQLKRFVDVRVDGSPPDIAVHSPERGSAYRHGDVVSIAGRVVDRPVDGSGVKGLLVNGKQVPLQRDGRFRLSMRCMWGVRLIEITAVDRAGNQHKTQRTIRCHGPHDVISRGSKRSLQSVQLRIRQQSLDDGHRQSLDDIASILQRSFQQLSFDKVVPKTLAKGKFGLTKWGPFVKYRVQKGGAFQLSDVRFAIALMDKALSLRITLFGLVLPLDIKAGVIRQRPSVLAPMLRFHLRIGMDLDKGKLILRVIRISNDASKLRIQGLKGAVGLLRGVIESSVRNRLQKGMGKTLKTRLFPVLRRLLLSFQIHRVWRMRSLLGRKRLRPVSFRSRIASVKMTKQALKVGLSAIVKGHKASRYPQFTFPQRAFAWPAAGIAIAVSLQSINQLLQTLWEVGALKLDVSGVIRKRLSMFASLPIALPTPTLQISFHQPPVLMPGFSQSSFRLVLGDLGVTLGLKEPGGTGPDSGSFVLRSRLHLVIAFQFVPSPKGMTVALGSRPERLSIEIESLTQRGVHRDQRLLPAEMAVGIEQIVQTVMPRLAGALLRFVPFPSQRTIRLPKKLQKWLPRIRIVPKLIAYRGGYVLVAFDLK